MAEMQNKKFSKIFIYGVSSSLNDSTDIEHDLITNIRKRFLQSRVTASNKLYRSSGGINYVYSYHFDITRPLRWRVTANKRVIEEIIQLMSGKYCVTFYDEHGKDKKKTFFDSKHRWFKTNYYNPVSNDNLICSLVPKEFDEGTSILKYATGGIYPIRLYPCSIPSCDVVKERLLQRIPTPQITALTDRGIMYFMTDEDKENYEYILSEEEAIYASETAPPVFVTKEDIDSGFNLSVNDFDMSKNLNRSFDISLAKEFSSESSAEFTVKNINHTPEFNEVKAEPVLDEEAFVEQIVISKDASVDEAITDVVEQINSRTSLEIDPDDILSFSVDSLEEREDALVSVEENDDVVTFGGDASLDEQLEHIESVLEGNSIFDADKKLVIGDSVVDDDYISSIIDGIMSSAFSQAMDESDGEESTADIFEPVHESDDDTVSEIIKEIKSQAVDTDAESEASPFFVNIPGESDMETLELQVESEEENPLEVTDVEDDIIDDSSDEMVALEEAVDTALTSGAEGIVDSQPDSVSEEKTDAEANESETDSIDFDNHEVVLGYNSLKEYNSVNTADSVIESRGDTYVYFGELNENGKRNGRGRTLTADGNIAYEGEYKDDKRNGQGSFYFKDGSLCYWGDWHDNVREGFGVGISSEDKAIHIGSWNENKPSGAGARFDAEGNLMFVSSNCDDKKKGFTISEISDKFFTIRVWDEELDAFVQRKVDIKDLIK